MSPGFDELKKVLADRYAIECEIGEGGMATVYLAQDLKHQRDVAIKVLRPELAASVGAERFLKEIEIAARLTHPHIVPLHDSGEAAGFLYYVMPFIDGESLRTRLLRERRLPTAIALRIADQVGDALSYAHRMRVLHRDVKPENILFAEGHPMVADFGIARVLSTLRDSRFTQTGMALGTPGYMSPEQAAGERDIDHRTDVYGLGCLLYEMLVGEPPGLWQTDEEAVRQEKFIDVPERHREQVQAIGRSIERALVRALAMRTRDRFDSVDAFLDALHRKQDHVRRYSDTEVQELVRHAADEELAESAEGGMSLKTVEQIAAEVGISSAHVARAARELDMRMPSADDLASGEFWLGHTTRIDTERAIEAEAGQGDLDEIVHEIETALALRGEAETQGASFIWRTEDPKLGQRRAVQVRVTSRGGRTRIHVQERLGDLAATLFIPISVGGGGAGLGVLLPIFGPELGILTTGALGAGWVAGMYTIARTIFRGVARGKRRELDRLGERLAEIVEESSRNQVGPRGQRRHS